MPLKMVENQLQECNGQIKSRPSLLYSIGSFVVLSRASLSPGSVAIPHTATLKVTYEPQPLDPASEAPYPSLDHLHKDVSRNFLLP